MKDKAQYNHNEDMSAEEAMNQGLTIIKRGRTYSKKERIFPQLSDNECIAFILSKCGFAQKKIAKLLVVSQQRVSRLFDRASKKLNLK